MFRTRFSPEDKWSLDQHIDIESEFFRGHGEFSLSDAKLFCYKIHFHSHHDFQVRELELPDSHAILLSKIYTFN